jgi:hypothetical protein
MDAREETRWRTLDLFCGAAGGWSLGLHRAGFTTVAACEVDPWRRSVFGRNNPGVVLYDDVRTLGADRLLRDLGFLPEIVCGSPPCQDASTANTKGRGVDGERTGLFFDAVRIVREVRPRWVLLENVPGPRGSTLRKARGDIHSVEDTWDRTPNPAEFISLLPSPRPCTGLRSRGVNQTEIERKLLPTPTATEYGSNRGGAMGRTGEPRPSLRSILPSPRPCTGLRSRGVNQTEIERKLLPTPRAHNGGPEMMDGKRTGRNLEGTARLSGLLPMPTKQDSKNVAGPSQVERNTPPLSTYSARSGTGTAGLLILVEWMMGYPRRWLLNAALAVSASPPTATRSSRRSPKR